MRCGLFLLTNSVVRKMSSSPSVLIRSMEMLSTQKQPTRDTPSLKRDRWILVENECHMQQQCNRERVELWLGYDEDWSNVGPRVIHWELLVERLAFLHQLDQTKGALRDVMSVGPASGLQHHHVALVFGMVLRLQKLQDWFLVWRWATKDLYLTSFIHTTRISNVFAHLMKRNNSSMLNP